MRIILSKMDGTTTQRVQPKDISELCKDANNLVWVDIDCPTDTAFNLLREEFHFHELALEDAWAHSERPKLDTYEDYYLMVIYAVRFNQETVQIDEYELDIFVGKNYIVTVHDGAIVELDDVAKRWEQNAGRLKNSVGVLLYTLIDTIIDDYFPVLDAIGDQADEIEAQIFGRFNPSALAQIFSLRKELLNFRRVLGPERDLLLRLSRRELPVLGENSEPYFQDVYDHVTRATDSVDLYRDLLNSALDSYLSLASNNLNITVRTLTVWTIILMIDALIAGVYGMNFVNIPELHFRYGYFATLFGMFVLSVGLFAFFRKRGWL